MDTALSFEIFEVMPLGLVFRVIACMEVLREPDYAKIKWPSYM